MSILRYTLVSEGTSDADLIPIITWVLREVGNTPLSQGIRVDFRKLPEPPKRLEDKLIKAVELFSCDAIFIHRDADRAIPKTRHDEIRRALDAASKSCKNLPAVAVVPVKML